MADPIQVTNQEELGKVLKNIADKVDKNEEITPEELDFLGKFARTSGTRQSSVSVQGPSNSRGESKSVSDGHQWGDQTSRSDQESTSTSSTNIAGVDSNDQESVAAYKKRLTDPIRQGYQNLTDAIGASSERSKKLREQQEQKLLKQQKMNDLVASGRLLSDIITAGVGGNVYKRDAQKDDTSEQINKLKELQAAEDAQNNIQRAKNALEMSKAILGVEQGVDNQLAQRVNTTKGTSKGSSHNDSRSHNTQNTNSKQWNSGSTNSVSYGDSNDAKIVTSAPKMWGGSYGPTWVDNILVKNGLAPGSDDNFQYGKNFENQNK